MTTVLKDPSMQEAAGRVYKEMYYKEYDHFRAMAQLFYEQPHCGIVLLGGTAPAGR